LLHELAARAAVAIENAQLYAREHRVAMTLQRAMLPAVLPEVPGLTFDAVYFPGATEAEIGGDWYDAIALADGRVVVSIGDVTGRGLTAAVIMGRMRQAIETLATYESDPVRLLDAADSVLRRSHPDAIVTALVGDRRRSSWAACAKRSRRSQRTSPIRCACSTRPTACCAARIPTRSSPRSSAWSIPRRARSHTRPRGIRRRSCARPAA